MAKRVGRPSKITPEITARLVEAFKKGAYKDDACAYAGIGYSTFNRYMAKGEVETKGKYKEFREIIKGAEAQGILAKLTTIDEAATGGDWRAAAWWLSHKEPTKYGDRERLDITNKQDNSIGQLVIEDKELSQLWTTTLRRAKFKRRGEDKPVGSSDGD